MLGVHSVVLLPIIYFLVDGVATLLRIGRPRRATSFIFDVDEESLPVPAMHSSEFPMIPAF